MAAKLGKAHRFASLNGTAVQSWCQDVLQDRFKAAYIAHHRPINTLKLMTVTNSPRQRAEQTGEFCFDFSAFAKLLDVLGFWERVGIALKPIQLVFGQGYRVDFSPLALVTQEGTFPRIINAINGGLGAEIDYEGLYPEAERIYRGLKIHRFCQQDSPGHEQPSSLTVPDILFGAILERLNRGLPAEVRAQAEYLSLLNLDGSIPNGERILACQGLERIYKDYPVPEDQRVLANALEQALEKLGLSRYGQGGIGSIEQLKAEWGGVDLVVPVMHYDYGRASWEARCLLQAFPDALVCPAGLQAPYYVKGLGSTPVRYSEAEEMIATLLCDEYPDNFRGLPGMNPLPPYSAAQLRNILIPDEESGVDTPGNARYVASRLPGFCDILQRKANVLVVTTAMHSARARAEFHAELAKDLVLNLGVWEIASPVMHRIGNRRDAHGILGMLCEYTKRLHRVATS